MADDDRKGPENFQSAAIAWARYSEIAFIIPAAVVVGLLLGMLGDHFFHIHWLIVAGVIFGAVVGFIQLIRMVTREKS
jgi:F0F1-type ATP synthase assembly protein I